MAMDVEKPTSAAGRVTGSPTPITDYAVSSVCFRSYDFATALDVAGRLGFSAVDLVGLRGLCEHVPVNGGASEYRAAAQSFRRSGLRGSSLNADPGSFDGQDDASEVMQRIDRLLGFAAEIGVPLLVLPCGEKTDVIHSDPQLSRMGDALNRVAEKARSAGVRVAVEAPYFGRPVHDLERTGRFLDALDPAIELAYDVSHVEAADESVVGGWERFGDRVGIIHLRDAVSGNIRRVIGAGRVDFATFLQRVRADGFRGDMVLELETRDSPYSTKEEEVMAAVGYLEHIERNDTEIV